MGWKGNPSDTCISTSGIQGQIDKQLKCSRHERHDLQCKRFSKQANRGEFVPYQDVIMCNILEAQPLPG